MTQSAGPAYLAHWVVKTARARQMIDWYGLVFGAHVVHEDDSIAFLTWVSWPNPFRSVELTLLVDSTSGKRRSARACRPCGIGAICAARPTPTAWRPCC
jgi:hypothetical protein